MRSSLFLSLAQLRTFWKARVGISRLGFLGFRQLFGMKRRIQEHGIRTKSLLALLRLTLGQLVTALVIAIGLQISNPCSKKTHPYRDINILPSTVRVTTPLCFAANEA